MRMRKLVLILMLVLITTTGAVTAKKIYPYRWVRVGAGLRNAADVEKVWTTRKGGSKPWMKLQEPLEYSTLPG